MKKVKYIIVISACIVISLFTYILIGYQINEVNLEAESQVTSIDNDYKNKVVTHNANKPNTGYRSNLDTFDKIYAESNWKAQEPEAPTNQIDIVSKTAQSKINKLKFIRISLIGILLLGGFAYCAISYLYSKKNIVRKI